MKVDPFEELVKKLQRSKDPDFGVADILVILNEIKSLKEWISNLSDEIHDYED